MLAAEIFLLSRISSHAIIAKGKEIDYTALLLAQTNQRDYEQLCQLDVLGIADRPEHDQTDVYTEFREQLVRSEQGWYETGLPWKGNHPTLPSNKNGSLRRLNNLTRKLSQTELTKPYEEIIEKQKEDGIIEDASNPPSGTEFYIPHKPVVREAAESTKLRIAYDASARVHSEAPSLNDCLNAGPPLQNRLGLVSSQTLQGKLVYRETCQRKLGWDAPIENDLKQKWLRWEQSLPKQVNAPRSLVTFHQDIQSIEFHAFHAVVR